MRLRGPIRRTAICWLVAAAAIALASAGADAGVASAARTGQQASVDGDVTARAAPPTRFGPTTEAPRGGRTGRIKPGGNRWRYRAVLGRLRPNQRVTAPVVAPPTVVPGTAPLTGRVGSVPERTAVIIKVDNTEFARPQRGLREADIVYEELVEGGQTRLAAVYHSRNPGVVAPVRSARSTDLAIVGSYRRPIFGFSGSNEIFGRMIARGPLVDRGAETYSGYRRDPRRPAPYNLTTTPRRLRSGLRSVRSPEPQFAYRAATAPLHADAVAASQIRLRYERGRGTPISFRWSERKGAWLRTQAGSPHRDARGRRIAPRNVIVQIMRYPDTGLTDRFGEVLYEGVAVGTGRALVFSGGEVVHATWTRPSLRSVTTYTDADGEPIALAPGQTWVAMVPRGSVTFDAPRCRGRVATIVGTAGADRLRGTAGRDVIVGGAGDDRVRARGGNDVVCGGGGDDRLFGGPGADLLVGGPGNDRVVGGPGPDRTRS